MELEGAEEIGASIVHEMTAVLGHLAKGETAAPRVSGGRASRRGLGGFQVAAALAGIVFGLIKLIAFILPVLSYDKTEGCGRLERCESSTKGLRPHSLQCSR